MDGYIRPSDDRGLCFVIDWIDLSYKKGASL